MLGTKISPMDPSHISTTTTEDQNSKTTIVEPDQANDMGSGRSYECVYCKRGFTTAQALGGHMNIHRKDHSKTKHNSSKPETVRHRHSTTHDSSTTSTTTTTTLISTSHRQSFQTYFPTSSLVSTTSSITPPCDHKLTYVHNNLNNNNTLQALNMSNENWTNIAFASHSLTPSLIDHQHRRFRDKDNNDNDDADGELDLELRLGHDR